MSPKCEKREFAVPWYSTLDLSLLLFKQLSKAITLFYNQCTVNESQRSSQVLMVVYYFQKLVIEPHEAYVVSSQSTLSNKNYVVGTIIRYRMRI